MFSKTVDYCVVTWLFFIYGIDRFVCLMSQNLRASFTTQDEVDI